MQTVSTVKYAKVDAWDNWGITIDGRYQKGNNPNTQYTYASGGFVGNMSGTVLGDKDSNNDSLIVNNVRKVTGWRTRWRISLDAVSWMWQPLLK